MFKALAHLIDRLSPAKCPRSNRQDSRLAKSRSESDDLSPSLDGGKLATYPTSSPSLGGVTRSVPFYHMVSDAHVPMSAPSLQV